MINYYYDLGSKIIMSYNGRSIRSVIEDYMSDNFIDALEELSLKDLSINKEYIEFPMIINEFIMSIILWCNFPLNHEVSLDSNSNVEDSQYNEAIKDYVCLSEAIIQDAFCIHRYVNLKEGNERGKSIDDEIKKYFSNSILYKSSLLYPVDYISSEQEDDINHIDYFKSFYKKEAYYSVYPAAFIVWLNCYDPNMPSKSIYEPRYKLLLTLLLPKRTMKEYAKKSDFDLRLYKRILKKKQNKRLLSEYEDIYKDNRFSYNDNEKYYDKLVKKYLKKDYTMRKILQNNFDFNQEEHQFWNDLKGYASKREKNKRYDITYGNIIAIRDIFSKIDNNNYSPSKSLSLIYLNNYTKWIDLLLLEKDLQLEATDIYGLRTKWLLCSIYNKEINDVASDISSIYYSQANLIEYKKDKSKSYLASIRVEENDYFLPSIVDGINIIIKLSRLFFDDLLHSKKQSALLGFDFNYKNAYNDIFDELINESFLKEISKKSIVRLAEYEYYK